MNFGIGVAVAVTCGLVVGASLFPTRLQRLIFLGFSALLVSYLCFRIHQLFTPGVAPAERAMRLAFFALECLGWAGQWLLMRLLGRSVHRSAEADRAAGWWRAQAPLIDVLIPTYSEPERILERTILAAGKLDYPRMRIWVLDDGEREWLRSLATRLGVGYLARQEHGGGKAGNLNWALGELRALPASPEFIAVLDADFCPRPQFLRRALSLMYEPTVALVQVGQSFFSPDPFQYRVGIGEHWPDDERLLFNTLNPALDAHDSTVCCGSSFLVRELSLREVGDFPVDSVSEDTLLSLNLRDKGWRLVYLGEALSMGLATEGLAEYLVQRARWCIGTMQIVRSRFGPFSLGRMRGADRAFMLENFSHWAIYPFLRMSFVVLPILYWVFDFSLVTGDSAELFGYGASILVYQAFALAWLSRGMHLPIVSDAVYFLTMSTTLRAAIGSLLRPKSYHFVSTAKGLNSHKTRIHWRLLGILLGLSLANVLAALYGWTSSPAGSADVAMLVWSCLAALVLFVAALPCVEKPRYRREERFRVELPATLWAAEEAVTVRVSDVSAGGALISTSRSLRAGQRLTLELPLLGAIPGHVAHRTGEHTGIAFDLADEELRRSVVATVYSGAFYTPLARTGLLQIARALVRRWWGKKAEGKDNHARSEPARIAS